MANPTKQEFIKTLTNRGLNPDEISATFVQLFGVTPENMVVEGPLPNAGEKSFKAPFEQDVTPTQMAEAREAAERKAAEEQAAASRAELQRRRQRTDAERREAIQDMYDPTGGPVDDTTKGTGVLPAVAGAAVGVADSLSDIFAYTRGDRATTDKAISDSFARQEEFIKSRIGQSEYENLAHDAFDLISILPNIGSLMFDVASRGNSFERAREIAKSISTDSATVYPFLLNNWERSYRAAPLSTILAAIPAAKAAGALAALGSKGARLTKFGERIHQKINAGLDRAVDIGPTIKARTTFRRTGDEVKPGIYEHSIGDAPVTYRDILKAGTKGAAAGLIAGGTAPATVGAFIAGAGLSALRGKLNRTGLGAAFTNKMGILLGGISNNMKVSHELAMRNLFARGPEAEAKLQALGAQIAQRLRQGDDLVEGEIMQMAQDAFPDLIAKVEFGRSGRRYDVKSDAEAAFRPRTRRKINPEIEADLKRAETMLAGLLGQTRSRRTMMLVDDLLSEGSVQFGRVDDVRQKAINLIEQDLGRKLSKPEKADLAETMEQVSNTPFHREAGINLKLKVGDRDYDLRNLVTRAHAALDPARRKSIIAGLAADIITSNRNQIRKQSFARAAAESSDAHMRKLGLDPVELAKLDLREAAKVFAMAVMEDVVVRRGAVPLVGPTGMQMQTAGRYLKSLANEDPNVLFDRLEGVLNRKLTDGEKKIVVRRSREIGDEMLDSQHRDIADEGARAAEGYYGDTDRGSVYDRMESLIEKDFLDEADVAKVKSFFKSVDNSRKVIEDERSLRGPLTQAFQWLHNSADHGSAGRSWRLLTAHIKANYTTRNINAHINNSMSNLGLLAYDRGIDPATILFDVIRDTGGYFRYTKGAAKDMTDRQRRMYKQIDRAGFAAGDITMAEIQNLSRLENLPKILRENQTLQSAVVGGTAKGLKAVDDVAAGVYRLGDVGPKINESMHSMRQLYRRLDEMVEGQTYEFRTSPVSTTIVERRGNGLFIGNKKIADFITKNGETQVVGNKLDDLAGQHGRLRANERFFDYRDRPGILRLLDRYGAAGALLSYVNPYLTWAWKATGIGGRGLFSVVNKYQPEYRTNTLKGMLAEEASAASKWYRRAITAQALRSQFSENPGALRDALGFADMPGQQLSVLINRMASPDVIEVRNLQSMNPFSREFLKFETMIGVAQDLMMDTGLLRKDVEARRRAKQMLGETGLGPRALQLGLLTGGPGQQILQKINDGKSVSARDMLALVLGQTPALGLTAIGQVAGLGDDSAYTMMQERLPPESRPSAREFYFRKMFNYGWDKELVLNKRGKTNGRLNRYFAGIKKRMTEGYFEDLIKDYRAGKIDLNQLRDAERMGREAYYDRFQQVDEAFRMVAGRGLPRKLRQAPKLNYKKARAK